MKKLLTVGLLLAAAAAGFGQTFDLRFQVITNDGTHFDVKVQVQQGDATDWQMGTSNYSFNFNTTGLDHPTLQTAHNFTNATDTDYNNLLVTDNGTYASINIDYTSGDGNGTDVPQSWTDVATVRFDVLSTSESSNLQWRTDGATSCFDDDESTVVSPGSLQDLDQSLPVTMQSLAAVPAHQGIQVSWETASQAGVLGYHVWRAEAEDGQYTRITTALIPAGDGGSTGGVFEFNDREAQPGTPYWYKIEEISGAAESWFHGPIKAEGVPESFALSPTYPNPFNPETTFKYQMAEPGMVTVRVYDIRGREVRTLVDANKLAGTYTVTWDGRTDRGMRAASGIYLLRMETSGFSQIQKMSLIR